MKIIKSQKINKFLIILAIFTLSNTNITHAWTGYDYDNEVQIEIGPGNLVREGLVIQFYDEKDGDYHNAKVLLLENDDTWDQDVEQILKIEDLDTGEIRTFIME